MGGSGGGIAYNREEFEEICARGLDLSPTKELLIDESLIGWKEYEMEVVRDKNDNCIIVCSIENFDAMGIHTGDSITVAPAQTLTDKEYQIMRNASMAVLREIGVETGGSNVQFAVNPKNGRLIVIEMNPRVSRSSALASKATGFPIAKVAAKLAVGYTLDELMNDITGGRTPASFEPSIDYVVTKIPRFNFEKFAGANDRLTTQMKSVGEVMAIGRTQQESLQKALRGTEVGATGFDPKVSLDDPEALTKIRRELKDAGAERIWYIADAFRAGLSVDGVFNLTNIDRWFPVQIEELVRLEEKVAEVGITGLNAEFLRQLKRKGFADARLAKLAGVREAKSASCATSMTCTRFISAWIPVRQSSPPTPLTCTPLMKKSAKRIRLPTVKKSWFSAAARTVSVRVSNSTTAVYTPRWRCAKTVTKPLWLTVTRKPSPPTTTLPIASTSSR